MGEYFVCLNIVEIRSKEMLKRNVRNIVKENLLLKERNIESCESFLVLLRILLL